MQVTAGDGKQVTTESVFLGKALRPLDDITISLSL
jgi:hypothetical protein